MRALGLPHLHRRQLTSTNDLGKQLAATGAPHGTLLSAEQQTAGRGRRGRTWFSEPGSSLLISLILRSWPQLLPLASALAVCDVAEGARVKWPNDVVVPAAGGGLRKLAGILIEGRPREGWMVLGIGVNVALDLSEIDAELAMSAATMGLARRDVSRVLAELLDALEVRLAQTADETLGAWRERDALLGRSVSWQGGSGIASGLTPEGKLLVRLVDGSVTELAASEVHLTGVLP